MTLRRLRRQAGGLVRALQIEVMASTGTATPLQYELSVLALLSPATERVLEWRAGERSDSRDT